ncbi:phosphotransferase enzyme family protein [Nocardia sp. BMG51109]|uniref:phosphotransferase enzyme family protein n=1 Tax=Nocardia sp. BMG51109 TaxID=1056816 RepID=UPI00046459E3|nr:aminoglycoside phosphotransferase family protein [Nocardia sp. BMG51109]
MNGESQIRSVLESACAAAGLSADGAEAISVGENAVYRLPGHIVARISRPGRSGVARREVAVSRWLAASGMRAVRVVREAPQSVAIDGRPVVFWRELPPHGVSRPVVVAGALRRLHGLPPPVDIGLRVLRPFARLDGRIDAATGTSDEQRCWMRGHLASLARRWADLPKGLPWCVIHGDAHEGNIVTADDGEAIVLDLERFCIGPPEWDLVQTAVNRATCGWITGDEYAAFTAAYGFDVMRWEGFELLRDIREFRMTAWLLQQVAERPQLRDQAVHRLACLRGEHGARPWTGWAPVY